MLITLIMIIMGNVVRGGEVMSIIIAATITNNQKFAIINNRPLFITRNRLFVITNNHPFSITHNHNRIQTIVYVYLGNLLGKDAEAHAIMLESFV
jgi:hypothetical protein